MTSVIAKQINFEDKSFMAEYDSRTGEVIFYSDSDFARDYDTQIDPNPFKVINLIKKAFSDLDMPKISFQATGLTQRDVMIKDKLYQRALAQWDYNYLGEFPAGVTSDFKKESLSGTWKGPYRFYQKGELK